MNAICPYCGEPQHYSVAWMDTVVPCGHCGREFLLCNKPRDQVGSPALSPTTLRSFLEIPLRGWIFVRELIGEILFFPFRWLTR